MKLKKKTVFQFMKQASRAVTRTVWIWNSPGSKKVQTSSPITLSKLGYNYKGIRIYSKEALRDLMGLTTPPGHDMFDW